MTLKLKYRNPDSRIDKGDNSPGLVTRVYGGSRFVGKSNNSGSRGKSVSSLRPRRRAWGPW